jgi:6-phospho-beta-glucosidase
MMALVPNLKGGEVMLYDLDPKRLEAMKLMLEKSPEFAACDCKVNWSTNLAEALPGADMVSMSLMAGSWRAFQESQIACNKHDYMGSDQISPSGAFLGLKSAKIALDLARQMEIHCPQAWLVDFANPVPVVSAAVNNHTKIRALGICGGYNNHQWDLTRLQGRDEQDLNYDVDVAGVNHGSFIIRGTYKGEDLWDVMDRVVAAGFKHPEYVDYSPAAEANLRWALPKLVEIYRRHHCTIFSTEGDGFQHYFYEEMWERDTAPRAASLAEDIDALEIKLRNDRAKSDQEFQELAHTEVPATYWESSERWDPQITVLVAQALGGGGEKKIAASFPCSGHVAGFKDRTVLEYSFYLSEQGVREVPNLYVPDVYHGTASAIATHQTLLGDAVASEDPQVLFEALYAYPIRQNTREYWALCRDLLAINKDDINPAFQGAADYFWS